MFRPGHLPSAPASVSRPKIVTIEVSSAAFTAGETFRGRRDRNPSFASGKSYGRSGSDAVGRGAGVAAALGRGALSPALRRTPVRPSGATARVGFTEKVMVGGVAPGLPGAVPVAGGGVSGRVPGGGVVVVCGRPSTCSFMHSPLDARLNCAQFHSAFS